MKLLKIIAVVLIIAVAVAAVFRLKHYHFSNSPKEMKSEDIGKVEVQESATTSNTNTPAEKPIPEKVLIKVPFTVQAPNANWDATHEESCEEASLIILKHFIKKEPFGTAEENDQEILSMIKYETDHGYKQDVTMDELAQIAKDYYGFKTARVEKNISIDDIRKELAAGRPVIIPASGKLLDNPNFKNGGPLYHNLVIVGYDKNGFITNDPGTRKGEGFRYNFENLYNAIHDWNAQDINKGEKAYLVFD